VFEIETVFVLLAIVALVAIAADRIRLPYPILMVIVGLGIGLIPGVLDIELPPDLVLLLFLPPILFAAAFASSPRELWRYRRPISLLAFGLVLTTTLAVAGVMTALVPGMPFPVAVALGAIVSPPDAIAATAIARRLGLPRRLVTIIEAESLLNDATALVAYRFAVAAAVSGAFSLGDAALAFVAVAVGGVVIGLVVGSVVNYLFARLEDPPVEVLISIIAPFAAYLSAESLHLSGVLAAVAAGLWHGWRAPRVLKSTTRVLVGTGTWATMLLVVNGLAFLLIGLQLPGVLRQASGRPTGELLGLAGALVVTVIIVRLVWVFAATYLPRRLDPRRLDPGRPPRAPLPPRRSIAVLGWAGMRGAVSLAAALALPTDPPFPERGLIIFLTFATILATLVGQGLTLPLLIRRLGFGADGLSESEERHARRAANEAAFQRLDELVTEIPGHAPLIDEIRGQLQHRAQHYDFTDERDEAALDPEQRDHEAIRRAVLTAQRLAVIELRDRGVIGNEAMGRVERDIDLEEVRGDA
jgi:Na+/H+ antiporter